jgi:hypothetical protein
MRRKPPSSTLEGALFVYKWCPKQMYRRRTPQTKTQECYAVAVASRACIVSFKDGRGDEWYHVTAASTVFEGIRAAQAWFDDPFWKGPKTAMDTLFKVLLVGDSRVWRVRARSFFTVR